MGSLPLPENIVVDGNKDIEAGNLCLQINSRGSTQLRVGLLSLKKQPMIYFSRPVSIPENFFTQIIQKRKIAKYTINVNVQVWFNSSQYGKRHTIIERPMILRILRRCINNIPAGINHNLFFIDPGKQIMKPVNKANKLRPSQESPIHKPQVPSMPMVRIVSDCCVKILNPSSLSPFVERKMMLFMTMLSNCPWGCNHNSYSKYQLK